MNSNLEKVMFGESDEMEFSKPKKEKACLKCGHNMVDRHGECRLCIDWLRHVCEFSENSSEHDSSKTAS